MPPPLIGITASRTLSNANLPLNAVNDAYIQAVQRAGGLPVLIPVGIDLGELPRLRAVLGGILLSGGGDIHPGRYGGNPHPRIQEVDEARDELEIALVRLAARTGWPFLGICRGLQVINVALGGSLHPHLDGRLPSGVRHDLYPNLPRDLIAHPVSIQAGSLLARIVDGTELAVNSLHHQGIRDLAADLESLASSPDGLVEAVQLRGHPFGLGVQWHPEWLPGSPANQAIFRTFVEAAG